MKFYFDRKLFTVLAVVFILMTVIGTLSHEYGHYLAAKLMGYDARINYGMTLLGDHPGKSMSRNQRFFLSWEGCYRRC